MYLDKLFFFPEEKKQRFLGLGYRQIAPSDMAIFEPYYYSMQGSWSSPMSFMAMIAWGNALTFYYKFLGDYLVFAGWDATDDRMTVLPFIGYYDKARIAEAFRLLMEDFRKMHFRVIITDMRQWMKPYYDSIPGARWEQWKNDDLNDYEYPAEAFLSFHGKSGQNCRYFRKNYNYEVKEIDESDLPKLEGFIDEVWCSRTECESCNYGCPLDCVRMIVPVLKDMNGFGIMVYVDGIPVGYCIGSRHGKRALIQFQNTRDGYKGIGVFMYQECANRFLKDYDWISLGEDMGVPGIRTYKSRLAPHEWIPRFEYRYVGR